MTTKEQILGCFKDINHAYNDCTRYDTLKCMLDELQEPCKDAISRKAVLKIIDGWYEQNRDTDNIEDLIVLITYMDSVNPQKPKSECEHDHEILKAYSDGASAVLDKVRLDIAQEIITKDSDKYDYEAKWQNMGLRIALKVIDKYKAEGSDKE